MCRQAGECMRWARWGYHFRSTGLWHICGRKKLEPKKHNLSCVKRKCFWRSLVLHPASLWPGFAPLPHSCQDSHRATVPGECRVADKHQPVWVIYASVTCIFFSLYLAWFVFQWLLLNQGAMGEQKGADGGWQISLGQTWACEDLACSFWKPPSKEKKTTMSE